MTTDAQHNYSSSLLKCLFAATLFLSSFLLFQIQPIVSKIILPWFGGTPSVWTTALLFFQLWLLLGYFYSYIFIVRLPTKLQNIIHITLLILTIICLKQLPTPGHSTLLEAPITNILIILTSSVGLPYFVLCSTSPLIQAWYSEMFKSVIPYRLFALSNFASLLALLTYPFIFEPLLDTTQQLAIWNGGFVIFAILLISISVFRAINTRSFRASKTQKSTLSVTDRPIWCSLSFCGSTLLLAFTNQLCRDIAVIPFLWIAPLAVYLISFIIAFEFERFYQRSLYMNLGIITIFLLLLNFISSIKLDLLQMIALSLLAFYLGCMLCHGELAKLKPAADRLTEYYLIIALGGALGGIFNAILAPLLFTSYAELPIGMEILLFILILLVRRENYQFVILRRFGSALGIFASICIILTPFLAGKLGAPMLAASRNFFGILRVTENAPGDPLTHNVQMIHGGTVHGVQFVDPTRRNLPGTYYSKNSGAGLTLTRFKLDQKRNIGIVGLGAGTLALYGREGDKIKYYEINPDVEPMAHRFFTYISESKADVEVVLGDGRLALNAEENNKFDILILDAFNSDSIPVHLLTKEAFDIYKRHLNPDGVYVVHISNRYLDLSGVVYALSKYLELDLIAIETDEDPALQIYNSLFLILTSNTNFLNDPEIKEHTIKFTPPADKILLWMDNYSNLFGLLK